MNYTTNYHLPQWAEEDRIMMEDFNEAMEKIDEALRYGLTPENMSCQYGSFSLDSTTEENAILATFTFAPSVMLLDFGGEIHLIPNGSSKGVSNSSNTFSVALKLDENTVTLARKDDRLSTKYTAWFVIFP